MTEQLKQIIKEQMTSMPKEAQEVINAFGWGKISEDIGKKYFLVESEISSLQAETALIILGLADSDLYIKNIKDNVGISEVEAKKITEEVNMKIFKPIFKKLNDTIRNSMKDRSIHWQQNLDFILSGGDYTAFIRRPENPTEDASDGTVKNPPGNTTFNPSKLDDLKSKFTI